MQAGISITPKLSAGSSQPIGAVAIVASAGGIPALIGLLRSLPDTFPLPIFVAQHLHRHASGLDVLLSWHSPLEVSWAFDAEQPRAGCVYLAPPGMRLEVSASGLRLSRLPASASSWLASGDHLIKSVVALYGAHSVGVVLSGMLPAGVNGLRAVRAAGGFTMAQDRTSSGCFDMPAAAIDFGKAEIVMSPERMASVLSIIADSWHGNGPM